MRRGESSCTYLELKNDWEIRLVFHRDFCRKALFFHQEIRQVVSPDRTLGVLRLIDNHQALRLAPWLLGAYTSRI
jgi:hypothetical protein